jgi:flagellar biosynthesis/type III secretory pathway protein FliH
VKPNDDVRFGNMAVLHQTRIPGGKTMTVYVPKSLLSESAAQAAARLKKVQDQLSSAQSRLMAGDYARQKGMQETRLEDLEAAFESGPERGTAAAGRRLEQYRARMAEWDREHGKMWEALKTEISAFKAEQEQLERYLADYVGLRVELA